MYILSCSITVTSHIQIFADDTKICNTVQDSGILKNDLSKLVLWSKEWLQPFHTDKCKILDFGKNNPNIQYSIQLCEKLISASRTIKDLGIIFEDNFQFEEHMSKIINNANSKLGIIKNTFHELTIDNFIIMYKALVRPILEYFCTLYYRRERADVLQVFRIIKGIDKLDI